MTSVFPEVRIKRTIEVRGADCVPHDLALSFCAFFAGLLYSPSALDKACALQESFSAQHDRDDMFIAACRNGLHGHINNLSLAQWAEEFVDIARDGLAEWQPEALSLLDPLIAQGEKGESPAASLLRTWKKNPSPKHFIPSVEY